MTNRAMHLQVAGAAWARHVSGLADYDVARRCWTELLAPAYTEPHRHYHTLQHILDCDYILENCFGAMQMPRHVLPPIVLALWMHDVVYDTRADDNEERSAKLTEEWGKSMGIDDDIVARAAKHVRETKRHKVDDDAGALFVDLDLSILGAEPALYDTYTGQIREEYDWVPPDVFRRRRIEVLQSFAPEVYVTPEFRSWFGARARANIDREIAALRGDS